MSKDISLTKHVANAGSASHHNRNTTEELVNYSRGSCCHARYHYRLRSILVVCLSVTRWDGVFGQRSIVSLGSRLQKRPGSSSSQSMDDDAIIVKDDHIEAMGGLNQVDLSFEGIELLLETNKGSRKSNGDSGTNVIKGRKQILDGSIRGRARPGRMLAIMGPSGAGKSTVLHALAGRIKDSSKLTLYGRRYLNGKELAGDSMVPAAFIEQEVEFFPHMTVKETLEFRVHLKLGSRLSQPAREEVVDSLLKQLGLTSAADTIVGNSKVRGISGGERKRLSIAVEMISSPSVIFLDEPTSGLDATAASKLISTLRKLADAGKTIIAVIHQPSQHVFEKFDDLMLVADGRLMYFGERQGVRNYMHLQGCSATEEIGTAEHILDCITHEPLEGETEVEASSRIQRLSRMAATKSIDLGIETDDGESSASRDMQHFSRQHRGGPRANILTQFRLLLQRSFRETTRGKLVIFVKLAQQITTALIYGGIYNLGTNQASIQDRFGLLSLIAIGTANMAVAASIRSFPREKTIVATELASKMYRTLPYFIGKALSELPLTTLMSTVFGAIVYQLTGLSRMANKFRNFLGILATHGLASEATGLLIGAISPNSDVALALFPAFLVLNIIFDGKNISEENTPRLLKWVPKLGLIRWGYEGLCLNEFMGLEFDIQGSPVRRGPSVRTGSEALARFGLGTRSLADVFRAQLALTGGFYLLSYLGLTLTRQKFLLMKHPSERTE